MSLSWPQYFILLGSSDLTPQIINYAIYLSLVRPMSQEQMVGNCTYFIKKGD